MRPIQVWLPAITSSLADPIFEMDMQRAFQEWRGEQTVWFMPGIEKPYRWKEGQNPWDWRLAVPSGSGRWEPVDVYHVNDRGHVWGRNAGARFPNGTVDGLLEAWLNVLKNQGVKYALAPRTCTLRVPFIVEIPPSNAEEERIAVTYIEDQWRLQPYGLQSFEVTDEATGTFEAVWPPAGFPRPTISITRESHAYYGALTPTEQDGIPLVVGRDNPDIQGAHWVLHWDDPFLQNLIPIGADRDTLLHHGKMVDVACRSAENRQDAVHRAQSTLGMYVTSGWARWDALWLWPAVGRDSPERGLREAYTKARRRTFSVQEFDTLPWQDQIRKRVDITRAWGPIGLFWALLLDQLTQGHRFSECEDCHRVISGKRGKRYCGPTDDYSCFSQRRARDRRNERAR